MNPKIPFYFGVILLLLSSHPIYSQVNNVSSIKFELDINGSQLKIPIYTNYSLNTQNIDVEKATVVVHGTNRDADVYFDNMISAKNIIPELTENMLVLAPQFLTEEDIDFHNLDEEHLYWTSGGWKAGSNSRDESSNPRPERIPSYAVLDSLLVHIASNFPSLKSIVFTGHSAGAQVAQRMAASSPVADLLCESRSINTRFVVANPSSYLYMNTQRRIAGSTDEFMTPNTSCTDYNEWKYGLEDLFSYPEQYGVDSIRKMNDRRHVIYLLGANDNDPNSSSLDVSCEAILQGDHRLQRGIIYVNYIHQYYGGDIQDRHSLITVPNVGHNNFDMYHSIEGVFALFEKENETCSSLSHVFEKQDEYEISIYPNPAKNELYVSLKEHNFEVVEVQIYDLQGKAILFQKVSLDQAVNISGLKTGMYILRLNSATDSYSSIFTVE